MLVNINGELRKKDEATIVLSSGFFYGQSLFETILVEEGKPCFIDDHLQRLYSSAPLIDLTLNTDKMTIKKYLFETIKYNKIDCGSAKIIVSKNEKTSNNDLIISVKKGIPYNSKIFEQGFKLVTVNYKNNPYSKLTYLKTCNYLNNILARQEAQSAGGDEGLICNVHNKVAEGTVSNIFIIKKDKVYTPHIATGLLPGIVRGLLLRELKNFGYYISEKTITYDELVAAEEIFITNSLMGIMPVVKVDEFEISLGRPGKITKSINEFYNKLKLNNICQ